MLQKIIVYDKDKQGNIREKPEMGVMVSNLLQKGYTKADNEH